MAEFLNQKKPRRLNLGRDGGFNAFGKFVPPDRQSAAYRLMKDVIGVRDSQEAWTCVTGMAEQVARDEPYEAVRIGMKYVDLTGAYMLISALCTAPTPQAPRT